MIKPQEGCIDVDVTSVFFQDKEPRGIIPLENLSIREVDEPRKPVRSNTHI